MTGRRVLIVVGVVCVLLIVPALVARPASAPRQVSSTFDLDAERRASAAASRSAPTTTTSTSSTTSTTEAPREAPTTAPEHRATGTSAAVDVEHDTDPATAGELIGRFVVTCYGPPDFPAGQHTATGDPVGPGSIAVDPRIIPLGTELTLDGLGDGRANDTGGAIRGYHVDEWRDSCAGWPNPTVNVYRR